ncbi:MAG: efflux RND transporter periplasmic adaptor subunit, partial [Gammaproteobacteria bacterium]|nr:efflux RND transporter periplasmic adaptor subunit [Gammaproteobacteria bacterium]
RPGMSFRVAIDVEGGLYAAVNETALQWSADGAYLWAIANGTATRMPVQIVQRREGRVLVDGNLTEGDVIVVEGTQRMRRGLAVNYDVQRVAGQSDLEPISDAIAGTGSINTLHD